MAMILVLHTAIPVSLLWSSCLRKIGLGLSGSHLSRRGSLQTSWTRICFSGCRCITVERVERGRDDGVGFVPRFVVTDRLLLQKYVKISVLQFGCRTKTIYWGSPNRWSFSKGGSRTTAEAGLRSSTRLTLRGTSGATIPSLEV